MTVCLYECLKAAGLQHHYVRFTSMGVCRADHISGLRMEDYPLLGIRSMEDRTRLFHLVQIVKNLDPKSFAYDGDNVCDDDTFEESSSAVDGSSPGDDGNPDEDVNEYQDEIGAAISNVDVPSFARPSHVRRRLDFRDEPADLQRVLFSHPADTVQGLPSHNRNNNKVQEKGLAAPVELRLHSRNALLYDSRESNNHKLDAHASCCQCDCHSGENNKLNIRGINSTLNSNTRLAPKSETFNNPKLSPATANMPKTFNNKPFQHKDKNKMSDTARVVPVYEAKRASGYNYGLPQGSTHTPHKKQVGGRRIRVCVRKRPLTRAECRRRETDVVTTSGGECVIVHENKEAVDLTQYILQHKFYFDQVFGEESSNEEVYQKTAYPLVQHMLSGGKATCFAYGQTGAGKTHTMLGSSPGKPGLYALAVRDIFAHLSTTYMNSSLLVYVSFFEIYCGQLYDLLDHRKRLFAREDGQKVVHISRLRDVRVDSVSSLLEVISQGTAERTQGMSGVNPLSSRSHALLQIQLRDLNQQITGRMWFVDLAGSERASDAKEPDRQSRMEGAEINQSLLALKECIRSLDREELHTPFRQSKLTLVLKDSFLGDSMTCMIANISPGHSVTEHTLNTLRYADRVKELRGGLKGRRGSKMVPFPRHSLSKSSSSSSVGTPKKTKLKQQSQILGSNTPSAKLHTAGRLLCSTPMHSICGEESQATATNGTGLEYTTPVRGWLGVHDKSFGSKGANERETRRVENESYESTHSHYVREKNARAVLEQENNQQQKQVETHQACSAFTKRESGFSHRVEESWQHTVEDTRGIETERLEPRGQVGNSRSPSSEVVMQSESGLHKVDDMERKKHLRHYHQQLQQFTPSSVAPSAHVSSTSTWPSFSSSGQWSLSSLQHSSPPSLSAQTYHASASCRAKGATVGYNTGQMPSSVETYIQMETSPKFCNCQDEDALGNSGSRKDPRFSLEEIEAHFREDWSINEKRGSIKARGEAKVQSDSERPAGMKGVERKCAWGAATEMEPANRMAGPTSSEAQPSYSCNSETRKETGLDTASIPKRAEQKQSAGCYSTESAYSHPTFESQHQHAPAERPLSPPFEHTLMTPRKFSSVESKYTRCNANIRTFVPLQNTPEATIQRKKASCSVTSQPTALPVATIMTASACVIPAESSHRPSEFPVYTAACNCPDTNAKKCVPPQDETSGDYWSFIMDPLSISLLQVDQQAASASFLQGNNSNSSVCPAERDSGDRNRGEIGEECRLCDEMDEEKTLHPIVTNTNHTERQIYIKNQVCGTGTNKPHIPACTQASIQNIQNIQKNHTVPTLYNNKGSSCASEYPSDYAYVQSRKQSFSITTQQSGGSSVHSNILLSDQSSDLNISSKPNNPAELRRQDRFSNWQIKPTVHLLPQDNLNRAKWCIVKAHLEQLKEMEALCHKEGKLLCQQHDMALGEYVYKLAEIMERKARCANGMKAQLQPYLKRFHSMNPQTQ